MKRFLRYPYSGLVVSTVSSTMIGIAVFVFGAPPIILMPVTLIVGTIHFQLKSRVTHRFDRPRG